ncbi:PREDICTED: uncharacterized protein LOC109158111 [Ipomoea nil]|uniref:uncharacterized protein LOC109158111 n=1 Tax=Ipomoea nil TaxID=35883 RepID=UPI00090151F5|nr:PREDICTED: uncharacterized protein LOC109158111 [Ipomoea nil]
MAGSDSQKQLLTLIRDFASEKSQGERRISNLKNRIGELRSEIEAATASIEEAKRIKESIEQELKGYEVELAMNEASIQTLEARIASTQDEISTIGSNLDALKNEEGATRDDFIKRMFGLNEEIRKLYESIALAFSQDNFSQTTSHSGLEKSNEEETELAKRDLENKLAQLDSQITMEEEEYKTMQNMHKQVQEELCMVERRALLMDATMKVSAELLELNKQSSFLENQYTSLCDELQRKSLCPRCHKDNSEELGA